jgi:hypothetical protein
MSVASGHVKIGTQKQPRRQGARFGWQVVLAAVQDTAERSAAVASLADAGFSLDDFANINKPREIACTWLSRYEDRLEGRRGDRLAEERARVRAVRQRLEGELYP